MSKYDALTRYLSERTEPVVELSFDEIDRLIGGLPASGRKYQVFWSNSRRGQPHARSWLDAGRKARFDGVRQCVRFTLDHATTDERRAPATTAITRSSTSAFAPSKPRVGLVGCVKSKRSVATQAGDLYVSTLFAGRRRYVEQTCDRWYVLSAQHGLVHPDAVIEPYDVALKDRPVAERARWAQEVIRQLKAELGDLGAWDFEIHADSAYRDHGLHDGLIAAGARVETPAGHLNRGEQLAFYARPNDGRPSSTSALPPSPSLPPPPPPSSSSPLTAAPSTSASSRSLVSGGSTGRPGWRNRLAKKLEDAAQRLRHGSVVPEAAPPMQAPPSGTGAVTAALLEFGQDRAPVALARDPDANAFLQEDPFAFLVGVICDQGIVAERAWAAPFELRRRLGHWDLNRLASEPDAIRLAFTNGVALHRMVETVPRWISRAAQKVLDEYRGDAANIWSDEPRAAELLARLDSFEGIGQKKAAMAVEILERQLGVVLTHLDGSDVAYDVHIRRVFLRTGIAQYDDSRHMVESARRLHPARPGELDAPAWRIGREWCRPSDPRCSECPLSLVCPRLLERAADVRTM